MIFDSWGGVLADGAFQEFSLAYTARVLAQLHRTHDGVEIPRIVFTKGGGLWLEEMGQLDCEALGLDWTVNLGRARKAVGHRMALQGNLDPNVLFAPPSRSRPNPAPARQLRRAPHRTGQGPSHIFNLGHGISQHTPPEHVSALVDAVHTYSRRQRSAP